MKALKKTLLPILALTLSLVIVSCKNKGDDKIDPGFSKYITGFTDGVISKKSVIRVKLTEANKNFKGKDLPTNENLFEFSPSVEGKSVWVDEYTVEFRPLKALKSGTEYDVEFGLGEIVEVEGKFEELNYKFSTIKQAMEVKVNAMHPYEEKVLAWNQVDGEVLFADYMEDESAEAMITATQNGKKLKLNWFHDFNGKSHKFSVDSVARKEKEGAVKIAWNGSSYDVEGQDEVDFKIPSLSDFSIMGYEVVRSPEQYLLVHFSDPLDKNQDLTGLVHMDNKEGFKFSIEGNDLKAYTLNRQNGDRTITFEKGIKNIIGYDLKKKKEISTSFEDVKPKVELVGSGTILPSTDGLIFPFRAVNLKAVDVSIVKIFENNVKQFLQVNELDQHYQIRRVGRRVLKKRVNLTSNNVVDYGVWNNFTLDISDMIKTDPGAIYRVKLSYKKAYSLYHCEGDATDEEVAEEEQNWDTPEEVVESSYWDSSEDYYNGDYNWRDRDNPCTHSYYRYNNSVAKNILASNVGLVAKMGADKKVFVAVSDIRTTQPIANATVEVYNYQNQLIKSGPVDANGMVTLDLSNKPWLVVAKNGKERGYLKMDDGYALSTSKFDVQGQKVQKGIKGYIYGERGVWRPGDTLFLSFVLEDKQKVLPATHPVKFELINPLGQTVQKKVLTNGLNGFYAHKVVTSEEDPTGDWRIKYKVGGAKFEKPVKIETVKPNRLKVKLDFGVDMLSSSSNKVSGILEAKWLHGAIAKNLRADMEVTLVPTATKFKRYSEYAFKDPAKNFYSSPQTIFDGKVNELGIANISSSIKVKDAAPGFLKAKFKTRVFEESGDFSVDQFSIPYSPFDSYVGIKMPKGDKRGMLLTDTNHVIDIVTLDHKGNKTDVENLEVSVYKLSWRWWWETSSEDLGSYISNNYAELLSSTKTSSKNGKASSTFRINYPSWGRYFVRVKDINGGHSTGKIVYCDWPGWAGRGKRENPGGASLLSFSSDKKNYKVGESAAISIPTSGKGRALITVETGTKILQAKWVEAEGTELLHNIKLTPEMAPTVYVHVTLLQPHKHDNNLPIRTYGVIPLKVEDPNTKLKPQIKMPDELAPLSTVNVNVSEATGKPMTYTLAIVDEGLLDLTRFRTPNPHPTFYAREALGVRTWDLYNKIVGAYGGKLDGLLKIGGDEEAGGQGGTKVKRFKPMVRFVGPFHLDAGDSKDHKIAIPNYVGSVRTMVVAGENNAYGFAEKATPVKKPLMVLATMPRVLGPTEKLNLPVTVFAMDKKVKKVKVKVETNKLFTGSKTLTKTITFSEMGDKVINFDLAVGSKTGAGKVKVTVTGAGEKAYHEVDLKVRHSNPRQSQAKEKTLAGGKSDTIGYSLFGMQGTNEAVLEISSIPSINLKSRLGYLLQYPHGCVEQTTSKGFPQLYLADVMELNGAQGNRAKKNVKRALSRLKTFQTYSGGLSYWPGEKSVSDWGTNYAGHFMLEAEKKGFSLPAGMKDKWVAYQKKAAKNYNPSSYGSSKSTDFIQAYRLYTLALSGNPELGAMNRLKAKNKLSFTGLWRLASAYYLAGQKKVANQLVANVTQGKIGKYKSSSTYGSNTRDEAVVLESMSVMEQYGTAADRLKKVAKNLGSKRWLSTQETAYSLIAISNYVGKSGKRKSLNCTVTVNGKQVKVNSTLPVKQIPLSLGQTKGSVQVKNSGKGLLFAKLLVSGIPEAGKERADKGKLNMLINYYDMQGNSIDVTNLEQGTDFYAEIEVMNTDYKNEVKDIALMQIFPSGWEIINNREANSGYGYDQPDYKDIKDDRVMCYFDLGPGRRTNRNKKKFKVVLNAAYLGKFYLPTHVVSAMYDDTFKDSQKGKWVEVVQPGS